MKINKTLRDILFWVIGSTVILTNSPTYASAALTDFGGIMLLYLLFKYTEVQND